MGLAWWHRVGIFKCQTVFLLTLPLCKLHLTVCVDRFADCFKVPEEGKTVIKLSQVLGLSAGSAPWKFLEKRPVTPGPNGFILSAFLAHNSPLCFLVIFLFFCLSSHLDFLPCWLWVTATSRLQRNYLDAVCTGLDWNKQKTWAQQLNSKWFLENTRLIYLWGIPGSHTVHIHPDLH